MITRKVYLAESSGFEIGFGMGSSPAIAILDYLNKVYGTTLTIQVASALPQPNNATLAQVVIEFPQGSADAEFLGISFMEDICITPYEIPFPEETNKLESLEKENARLVQQCHGHDTRRAAAMLQASELASEVERLTALLSVQGIDHA